MKKIFFICFALGTITGINAQTAVSGSRAPKTEKSAEQTNGSENQTNGNAVLIEKSRTPVVQEVPKTEARQEDTNPKLESGKKQPQ